MILTEKSVTRAYITASENLSTLSFPNGDRALLLRVHGRVTSSRSFSNTNQLVIISYVFLTVGWSIVKFSPKEICGCFNA